MPSHLGMDWHSIPKLFLNIVPLSSLPEKSTHNMLFNGATIEEVTENAASDFSEGDWGWEDDLPWADELIRVDPMPDDPDALDKAKYQEENPNAIMTPWGPPLAPEVVDDIIDDNPGVEPLLGLTDEEVNETKADADAIIDAADDALEEIINQSKLTAMAENLDPNEVGTGIVEEMMNAPPPDDGDQADPDYGLSFWDKLMGLKIAEAEGTDDGDLNEDPMMDIPLDPATDGSYPAPWLEVSPETPVSDLLDDDEMTMLEMLAGEGINYPELSDYEAEQQQQYEEWRQGGDPTMLSMLAEEGEGFPVDPMVQGPSHPMHPAHDQWLASEILNSLLEQGTGYGATTQEIVIEIKKELDNPDSSLTVSDVQAWLGTHPDMVDLQDAVADMLAVPTADSEVISLVDAEAVASQRDVAIGFLNENLRKVFYQQFGTRPGAGRYEIRSQMDNIFADSLTLFHLYGGETNFKDSWSLNWQDYQAATETTEDGVANTGPLEGAYNQFLERYMADPYGTRSGPQFDEAVSEVGRLLNVYENQVLPEDYDIEDLSGIDMPGISTEDAQRLPWVVGMFGEGKGDAARRNLAKLYRTGGSKSYYAQQIHSVMDEMWDYWSGMGMSEADIFGRMTAPKEEVSSLDIIGEGPDPASQTNGLFMSQV